MQSFRGCTGRIGTNCDDTWDSSQAVGIARCESGVLVNNMIMIIIWTKCEIDVGPFSWCSLYLRGTGTLNRWEYQIRPNMHRHVHPESSTVLLSGWTCRCVFGPIWYSRLFNVLVKRRLSRTSL